MFQCLANRNDMNGISASDQGALERFGVIAGLNGRCLAPPGMPKCEHFDCGGSDAVIEMIMNTRQVKPPHVREARVAGDGSNARLRRD